MSKIVLAGDWHGDAEWGTSMVALAAAMGFNTIFHVGDYGVWPGRHGNVFKAAMQAACERHNVKIFVTLGNHEDYDQIDMIEPDADGIKWHTPNVGLLPRNFRWEINGRTFVSLGGAPSIDYFTRFPGMTWWPNGELITLDEAEKCAADGHADVMLTHDSPSDSSPEVENILYSPSNWPLEALAYARQGRETLDIAVKGVRPTVLVHGHFHVGGVSAKKKGRYVLSLDQQKSKKNMALLDLETLDFEFVDPWKEWGKHAPRP